VNVLDYLFALWPFDKHDGLGYVSIDEILCLGCDGDFEGTEFDFLIDFRPVFFGLHLYVVRDTPRTGSSRAHSITIFLML
jgi:hypothetical protein